MKVMYEGDIKPRVPATEKPGATDVSELIFKDDLTGLWNRRYMREFLAREVPWAEKSPAPVSLLIMDIDHFKEINDIYGHLIGDRVLSHLAQILVTSFRDSDLVIRYAGDEFIIILPETDKSAALDMAKRMLAKIGASKYVYEQEGTEISTNVSIGVAAFPEDARRPEELIERADQALYRSKREGRGRVSVPPVEKPGLLTPREILRNFPCRSLVGREQFLEKLKAYVRVQEIGTRIVVVEGEAGIGKTRLLTELVNSTQEDGVLWLVERCPEEHRETPYYLLAALLKQLVLEDPKIIEFSLRRMNPKGIRCLIEEVPELVAVLPRDMPPLGPTMIGERPNLLFTGFIDLFKHMSTAKPISLFIDEFQHVDRATLSILARFRADTNSRLTVFGALRGRSVKDSDLDNTLLVALAEHVSSDDEQFLIEMPLTPLDKGAVSQMISSIFPGREVNAEFDENLCNLCRGNPLCVEEILKDMVVRGLIRHVNRRWQFELPDADSRLSSLDDAIRSHLGKLDAETAQMLARAAVIGPTFGLDVLKSITGVNTGYALDLLDKARDAAVVVPASDGEDLEHSFISAPIRDVAYEDLDTETKKSTHEGIAEFEQERQKKHPERAASMLAFHFGRAGNLAKAHELREKARAHEKRIFDPSEIIPFIHGKAARKIREGDQPLSPMALADFGTALHFCFEAIRSMARSPKEAEETQTMLHHICLKLQYVCAEVSAVTVRRTDSGFLVNGALVDAKAFLRKATKFFDILSKHNGEALTIARRVCEREITVLLEALAEKSTKFVGVHWPIWLGERDVRNLYVDQKVAKRRYLAADLAEREVFVSREQKKETATVYQKKGAAKKAEAPRQSELKPEKQPPERYVLDERDETGESILSRREVSILKDSVLQYTFNSDLMGLRHVMAAVEERLSSSRMAMKLQAGEILEDIIGLAGRLHSVPLLELLAQTMQRRIEQEREPILVAKLAEEVRKAIALAFGLGQRGLAKKLIWVLHCRKSAKSGARLAVQLALEKLCTNEVLDALTDDLHSDDVRCRDLAARALACIGEPARPRLLQTIKTSSKFSAWEAAAEALKWLTSTNAKSLLDSLTTGSSDEDCDRVMTIFEIVSKDLARDILAAIAHPSPTVRASAIRILARVHDDWADQMLRRLSTSPDPHIAREAIKAIGNAGNAQAGAHLLSILPSVSDKELEMECYVSLGRLRYAFALDVLCKTASSKGFLGIFGGKSEALRAAAVWAMSQIDDGRVTSVLQKLTRDRSRLVSEEAKKALRGRHQDI